MPKWSGCSEPESPCRVAANRTKVPVQATCDRVAGFAGGLWSPGVHSIEEWMFDQGAERDTPDLGGRSNKPVTSRNAKAGTPE